MAAHASVELPLSLVSVSHRLLRSTPRAKARSKLRISQQLSTNLSVSMVEKEEETKEGDAASPP